MSFLKSNKFLFALVVIALIAFSAYSYLYKSHKNIVFTSVSFTGTSIEFEKSVRRNAAMWLGKAVVIKGKITQIDKNGIMLDNKIYCQFNKLNNNLILAQTQITIKGRMLGYDDLLEEVKLDQCIFQK